MVLDQTNLSEDNGCDTGKQVSRYDFLFEGVTSRLVLLENNFLPQ